MTWHSLIYNAVMIGCGCYALWRGGAPERICTLIILIGTVATALALAGDANPTVNWTAFWIDFAVAIAFVVLATTTDRFWPLAVTALQVDAVLIHVAKMASSANFPLGYEIGISIWAYPMWLLIAAGSWRHRQRLDRYGRDGAWSGRPEDR